MKFLKFCGKVIDKFLWLIIFCIAFGSLCAVFVIQFLNKNYIPDILELKSEAKEIISESKASDFSMGKISAVYASNGTVLTEWNTESENYIVYSEIPEEAINLLIATEDNKFRTHNGIDYYAMVRALLANVKSGEKSQGASTITQQLIKLKYLTTEKTYTRKILEIFCAMEFEKKYSKEKILEFYLNTCFYGNNCYGLKTATKYYFGKEPKNCNLSELAFVLAIPNNPSKYDPKVHLDNTYQRQKLLLNNYIKNGYGDKIPDNTSVHLVFQNDTEDSVYDLSYVKLMTVQAIMEMQGFEYETSFDTEHEKELYDIAYDTAYAKALDSLNFDGYKIYTSIDLNLQDKLQECVDKRLENFKELQDNGLYALQSSATCIDNESGLVVAMVGQRTSPDAKSVLNRAFQSYRQPGSSIKPVLVYTPAFDLLNYSEDTVINDHYENTKGYPKNANGKYVGDISIRNAVISSVNTVAYQIYQKITPEIGIRYLQRLGFSGLAPEDVHNSSLSIGGFTNGVSTLEMAKAYSTIAYNGICRKTTCISKITDNNGNVLWEYKPVKIQLYTKNSAQTMTEILADAIQYGTGKRAYLSETPCCGKTGTTNNAKDGWFCGYTHKYTTAVWVGYDTPKPVPGLQGGSYPAQIWHDYMEYANKNDQTELLAPYDSDITEETREQINNTPVSDEHHSLDIY